MSALPMKTSAAPRRVCAILLTLVLVAVAMADSLPHATATTGQPDSHAQAGTAAPGASTVNLELVLDASGSMAGTLPDGETKIDAARQVLSGVVAELPERDGLNAGLRVFGHEGTNMESGREESCASTELFVPIDGVDESALAEAIESYAPVGWTPITLALEEAGGDFPDGGDGVTNGVILVTDGEETCGGDPCAAATALNEADAALRIDVIGFGTTADQLALLSCVAGNGGGTLYGADDAEALSAAIRDVLREVDAVPATPEPDEVREPGAVDCLDLAFDLEAPEGGGRFDGGDGDDVIAGTPGDDLIHGGGGNDVICGFGGDDLISGQDGADVLIGGDGDDAIEGGAGDDVLQGSAGTDTLDGGDGADRLNGGDGPDEIVGGAGDDVIEGDTGNDALSGDAGNDALYGEFGNDRLDGGGDDDQLYGGDGDDDLAGGPGDDLLEGDEGNDRHAGGEGDDRLRGDEGDDRLDGGPGEDRSSDEDGANECIRDEQDSEVACT